MYDTESRRIYPYEWDATSIINKFNAIYNRTFKTDKPPDEKYLGKFKIWSQPILESIAQRITIDKTYSPEAFLAEKQWP